MKTKLHMTGVCICLLSMFDMLRCLEEVCENSDSSKNDPGESCEKDKIGIKHVTKVNNNKIEDVGLIDESLSKYEHDDPELIRIIKEKYLIPPSTKPYKFRSSYLPNLNGQIGQPVVVDEMLGRSVRNGFFIEAGAYDGELISNSLYFEMNHRWNGLLVEPNPKSFGELQTKNRKAWSLGNCFSTKTTAEIVEFDDAGLFGGIINSNSTYQKPADGVEDPHYNSFSQRTRKTVRAQCFPLYSVLLALDNPTVHYLSLDIEGAELKVLQTVPWDKVDIKILDIEMVYVGKVFEGVKSDVTTYLESVGYEFYREVMWDNIYVKKGFEFKREKTFVK